MTEKLHILLLEDNASDAELIERQLKKAGIGFVCERVKTRTAFLQALKTFRPDLILGDYSLPKFNALQALALRKKNAPLTPFIIVTGSISEEIAVECMKDGADDYLLKDHLVRLGEAVRHSLTNRRLQVEKIAAEESLRSNELLYRTFIDSNTDMVFLKDSEFRYLLANQTLCRFYGKAESEIIGRTDSELMGKSAAAKCQKTDKQALAENKINVSEETVGGLTFETRKFPVKLIDGRIGVGSYIRDISDRKRAEEALQKSEEKFRKIFEDHAAVKLLIEPESGAIIDANKAAEQYYGWTRAELKSMHIHQINTLSPEQVNREIKKVLSQKCIRFEFRHRRADGSIRDVEVFSSRIEMAGKNILHSIIHDISERKQAEIALRRSENLLSKIFDILPIGLWIADRNGKLVRSNLAGRRIWGAEPLVGQEEYGIFKARRLLTGEEIPPGDWALAHTIKEKSTITDEMLEIDAFDGTKKTILNYTAPVLDETGIVEAAVIVNLDISARQRAEEQIRASLLEKEVLLKEIHHRVKNNLQIISGLLTLQAAQINDERLQRMLKESQSRIWTMALIHQTLYQSGNLADIDMADYIRSLAGNLLSSHAQPAMPPTVSFDLVPVRLVTNAIKHAFPDGRSGEIRIALNECRDKSRLVPTDNMGTARLVPARGCAPTYELTVADNGAGLPAGFDPKNQKSLGLQLVDMLTKQLGGSLAIESRGGTAVHIKFSNNEKNEKQS